MEKWLCKEEEYAMKPKGRGLQQEEREEEMKKKAEQM
jgi:hypothetical protein